MVKLGTGYGAEAFTRFFDRVATPARHPPQHDREAAQGLVPYIA